MNIIVFYYGGKLFYSRVHLQVHSYLGHFNRLSGGAAWALVLYAIVGLCAADAPPWRLDGAAPLPTRLSISGSQRSRYESLDGQFRVRGSGGDQVLALRTLLLTELRFDALRVGAEIIDSRALLNDTGSFVSTTVVDPVELLQAYVSWDLRGLIDADDRHQFRSGRLTMNFGSRRLVARNLFRNTLNNFTGAEWRWHGGHGELRAFYTLPVNRKPNTRAELLDDHAEFDEEHGMVVFWGLYYMPGSLPWGLRGEVYLFGLDEEDADGRRTRDRQLITPGLRLFRPPSRGGFDFLIESVFQVGESRASPLSIDTTDLDHFAHFQHLGLGYSFAAAWSPRLIVQYDYASGDDDPDDGDNERFDTLFGARRFDLGPTGIYGPFVRGNLSTPGVRLTLQPTPRMTSFVAFRAYWLASDRDAWVAAALRDRSGQSGSFIGHQVEARFRWDIAPGNLRLEAGVAHLFAGEFMGDAPTAAGQGDATYLYTQATIAF